MKNLEYEKFLKFHPEAKRECKECGRKLGKEMVTNGLDAHQICLRKKKSKYNPKAIHSPSPYQVIIR